MNGTISTSDSLERVDLAFLLSEHGLRVGVLQFAASGEAPVAEAFETAGAYAAEHGPSGGVAISSQLTRHTVRLTLSPPNAEAIVVFDDASLTSLATAAAPSDTLFFDPLTGREVDTPSDPHVAVSVDVPAAGEGVLVRVHAVVGGSRLGETTVRCERRDGAWHTTHAWRVDASPDAEPEAEPGADATAERDADRN